MGTDKRVANSLYGRQEMKIIIIISLIIFLFPGLATPVGKVREFVDVVAEPDVSKGEMGGGIKFIYRGFWITCAHVADAVEESCIYREKDVCIFDGAANQQGFENTKKRRR